MTDKKITEYDALAVPAAADLVVMVDDVGGTPTTKKATVANLATPILAERDLVVSGRYFMVEVFSWADGVDCATGNQKATIVIPSDMDGMDLNECFAIVKTAGTTGTLDIQFYNVSKTQDMLSTKLTIDSAERTSESAATPYVINTANDDVSSWNEIRIDIDAVHTTPAVGLIIVLGFV